jgi:hypothetical protein
MNQISGRRYGASALLPAEEIGRLYAQEPGKPKVSFQVTSLRNRDGQVTAQVKVAGFKGVTSVQFTLQWDPDALEYLGTGDYGLPGLESGYFGTALVKEGKLTFSWDDPKGEGQSLADGTVIFTVNFRALEPVATPTLVALADEPTVREVTVNTIQARFMTLQPPALSADSVKITVDGCTLTLTGPPEQRYQIEWSENLETWQPLSLVLNVNGTVQYFDADAAKYPMRFYRAFPIEKD